MKPYKPTVLLSVSFSYCTQDTGSQWHIQSYGTSFSRVRTKGNFYSTSLKNGQCFFSKAKNVQFQKLLALSIPGHTPLHLELGGVCCSKMHSFWALNFKMMWTVIKDKNVSVSNWQLLTLHLQEIHEHAYMNTEFKYMPYIPTCKIFPSPFSTLSRIQTWLGNRIKERWDIHRLQWGN